jgi:hypothetical protein
LHVLDADVQGLEMFGCFGRKQSYLNLWKWLGKKRKEVWVCMCLVFEEGVSFFAQGWVQGLEKANNHI